MTASHPRQSDWTRREFVATTAAVAGAAALSGLVIPRASGATGRGAGRLKVGVIGCGGRGTGAAVNALEASPDVELIALGDLFPDRIEGCKNELKQLSTDMQERCKTAMTNTFTGVDAYKQVIATPCDIVILATAPGFRPIHFAAAVEAGKHVFMEKPVATCPAGVRMVIESAAKAKEKKLSVVAGTQRRHESSYVDAIPRLHDGAIGKVVSMDVYWNQGGLWMNKRQPAWTDAEWQIRNWLYFTWLSGDHICEQHVHNLDVAYWVMDALPVRVLAMGGRQVRTSPDYGNIYDHFACQFEYADGRSVTSYCRQIDGCSSRVEEIVHGAEGRARLADPGVAEFTGKTNWKWSGQDKQRYTQEHRDLIASITNNGPYLNEGQRIAESTLMAIMGRMSAYTGKTVTWEQAMNSKLDLVPREFALGPLATPEIAVPGKTKLV